MSIIKQFLKNIYYKKIKKWDASQIIAHHLRRCGMTIGKNTYIFSDDLETAECYLVTLGNDVMVSPNVHFTTHDASACYYIPGASDLFGRINIGDSYFLGMGAIILPGVTLADHCIVGAGSVVTKSFLVPGSVIAGNPARVVCTTEELRQRNERYALNTWGKSYTEKKEYLLANQDKFKGEKHGMEQN